MSHRLCIAFLFVSSEARLIPIFGMFFDIRVVVAADGIVAPAAEFAIRHGLTDIMPALCNVDFASMELLHARLIRTNTCVNGCRCDYTICGDQDPYVKEHPEYRDEAGFRRNK